MPSTVRAVALAFSAFALHGATTEQVRLWSEDLQYLTSRIKLLHPQASDSPGKRAFELAAAQLQERLPELTLHAFALELSALVAKLEDAHTRLLTNSVNPAFQRLPLAVGLYADGVFITAASAARKDLVGAQLLKFDAVSVDDVLQRLRPLISAENDLWFLQSVAQRLVFLDFLRKAGVNLSGGELALTLRLNGAERQVVIGSQEMNARLEVASLPAASPRLRDRHPESKYWFTRVSDNRIVYFRLAEVADAQQETLSAFATRLREELNNGDVDRLIIDLRGNGGGNYLLARPLLHALIQRTDLSETGKMIVLIDRGTFSAAVMLAVDLERHFNPVFIGEPTGNSPNFSAEPARLTLPHTQMVFFCSTVHWQNADPRDRRKWIAPLVSVEVKRADDIAGRDRALEEAVAWKSQTGLATRLERALESGGLEAMQSDYRAFKNDPAKKWFDTEGSLTTLAFRLMRANRMAEAIALMELNLSEHPNSANAHAVLADAVLKAGDRSRAAQLYKASLQINPRQPTALDAVDRLERGQ